LIFELFIPPDVSSELARKANIMEQLLIMLPPIDKNKHNLY